MPPYDHQNLTKQKQMLLQDLSFVSTQNMLAGSKLDFLLVFYHVMSSFSKAFAQKLLDWDQWGNLAKLDL